MSILNIHIYQGPKINKKIIRAVNGLRYKASLDGPDIVNDVKVIAWLSVRNPEYIR